MRRNEISASSGFPGAVARLNSGRQFAGALEELTRAVLEAAFPTRCAGCGTWGSSVCVACERIFANPFPVSRSTLTVPAYALAPYRDVARRFVLSYKEKGRRDLATPLGVALAKTLLRLPNGGSVNNVSSANNANNQHWWLVPAPSRKSASRRRGGPHIDRLGRTCAKALVSHGYSAAVAPALWLDAGVRDSSGLGAVQRRANMADRVFLASAAAPPLGTSVILLDDVITTGTTAAACVRTLVRGGYPVAAVLSLTATE